MNSNPPIRRGARAFTLIEMVLALAVFTLLVGGIFAVANGSMELSSDLTSSQDRVLMRQNMVEFLRKSFRTLPGEAELTLSVRSIASTYIPTVNITNGGTSFSPGHAMAPDSSIEIFAEERPGGYLRVGIRALDPEQTAMVKQNKTVKVGRESEIPLLDNVARFEWKFFDSQSGQWLNIWRNQGRPMFTELTFTLDDGEEVRAVFWLPPVVARQNVAPPPAAGTPGPGGMPQISNPNVNPAPQLQVPQMRQ